MVSAATVDIQGLQERAARAQPVDQVVNVDGWLLRYAPRGAWWLGSALPHRAAYGDDLTARVAGVEDFYDERDVPACFQITPGVCPDGLDAMLARRGYRRSGPVSLQIAVATAIPGEATAEIHRHPAEQWFATWAAVSGHGADLPAERDLLDRVDRPSAYAQVLAAGEVVAVGRAVLDTGWAGVFGLATRPNARGCGAAGRVLATLARWAADHRADGLYLQVEQDNEAALRLYHRAGFTEAAAYHYRLR